jgi:hypothetical protein
MKFGKPRLLSRAGNPEGLLMEEVSAMVRCALWLEERAGLETLNIGRGALDRKDSCTLQMFGMNLFYVIVLDGGFVSVSAKPMDCGDCLEKIVTVGDGPNGWATVCRLICAPERSGITSLTPKPIELGTPGAPDCFVIG